MSYMRRERMGDAMTGELDKMEDLLEQVVQGKASGPPREWSDSSPRCGVARALRPRRSGAFPDLGMLVRYGYAMPLMTVPKEG